MLLSNFYIEFILGQTYISTEPIPSPDSSVTFFITQQVAVSEKDGWIEFLEEVPIDLNHTAILRDRTMTLRDYLFSYDDADIADYLKELFKPGYRFGKYFRGLRI